MASYHPRYNDYTPPPPPPPLPPLLWDSPPLPHGRPPPPDWRGAGDSYRPSDSGYYPDRSRQSDFSFRNSNDAPQYPREQDFIREVRPSNSQYASRDPKHGAGGQFRGRQGERRSKARDSHRDNTNLNRPRRGNNHTSRPYKVAPADRPLLRRQNDGGNSPEQMLGMMTGQAKFMAAGDVSDSDEEQMSLSESESDRKAGSGDEVRAMPADHTVSTRGEIPKPPAKRRATAQYAQEGLSQPKWSNPDPYTVLPPVKDEQRKRKDVVKLIRKARKDADDAKATEHNQMAANDDFISFGIDDGFVSGEDIPSSPSSDLQTEYGVGVPGAPSEPRAFSHLQNLHNSNNGAPGIDGPSVDASTMGPPPGLAPFLPIVSEEIIIDMSHSDAHMMTESFVGDSVGNRKRSHQDISKGGPGRPMHPGKKNPAATTTGSILADWVPGPMANPTPWLQRTDKLNINAGFRLHKEICDFYDFVKPQKFEQVVREEILSRFQKMVSEHFPHSSVQCFGSYAAGLYLPTADIDVVVLSRDFQSFGQKTICQSNTQMFKFGKLLENSGLATPGSLEVITGAKVPIIKFVDKLTAIRIDVSFENDTGIIANGTFARWRDQYPAMPILVTVVKQFLMMRGLNEVVFGGLGGFSVTCLVTSLLQNMPRVQSGELIPEQHLGEILIEFFDFYGNRLDNTRTGLMMQPPGYFDKSIYYRPYARRQQYQNDRLAIIDPNKAENDISGGSAKAGLIFDRFSKAHSEILRAMKSTNRPSLLDWTLGGNYESFFVQRNRLLTLYTERWRAPAGVSTQFELPQQYVPVPDLPLAEDPKHAKNLKDVDSVPNSRPAVDQDSKPLPTKRENVITKSSAKTSSKICTPGISKGNEFPSKTTKDQPKSTNLLGDRSRANALKALYPSAKNIPNQITRSQKQNLIAQLTGNRIPHGVNKLEKLPPAKRRASALKAAYPHLTGLIPDTISKRGSEAFIKEHPKEGQTPTVVRRSAGEAFLNKTAKAGQSSPGVHRPKPETKIKGHTALEHLVSRESRYPGAEFTPINQPYRLRSSSIKEPRSSRQLPAKGYPSMLLDIETPLPESQRAEVLRNLSGTYQDDPISIE